MGALTDTGWLTDPFTSYAFFGRAMAALLLAGAICGALGAFVVVRRMSYIAHGLSHTVIGGAAVAAMVGIDMLLGAGVWALLAALLIGRVGRRRGLYPDTAIGIVTAASFALGIALISAGAGVRLNLESFLFGGILGVTDDDIALAAAAAVVIALVLVVAYRPLLFTTFDSAVAAAHGVAVGRYEALLAVLLTLGVVASMRVLGVLLVAAAVVVPPATARLLTHRFERLVPLSAALGAAGAVPGMYAAWHLDVAPGPAVVLTHTAVLAVVWVTTGWAGRRATGRRTASQRTAGRQASRGSAAPAASPRPRQQA